MLRSHMLPCPYDALWMVGGLLLCYFHSKVANELIEGSWRKAPRTSAELVAARRADDPDGILEALLAEWG